LPGVENDHHFIVGKPLENSILIQIINLSEVLGKKRVLAKEFGKEGKS
jgi:hypothetical protein